MFVIHDHSVQIVTFNYILTHDFQSLEMEPIHPGYMPRLP